jgi:hypothetical protein
VRWRAAGGRHRRGLAHVDGKRTFVDRLGADGVRRLDRVLHPEDVDGGERDGGSDRSLGRRQRGSGLRG